MFLLNPIIALIQILIVEVLVIRDMGTIVAERDLMTTAVGGTVKSTNLVVTVGIEALMVTIDITKDILVLATVLAETEIVWLA